MAVARQLIHQPSSAAWPKRPDEHPTQSGKSGKQFPGEQFSPIRWPPTRLVALDGHTEWSC